MADFEEWEIQEQISCSEAHPGADVYHPNDPHFRVRIIKLRKKEPVEQVVPLLFDDHDGVLVTNTKYNFVNQPGKITRVLGNGKYHVFVYQFGYYIFRRDELRKDV